VETMAVMAIIAVLSGMAVPSMSAVMDSVKLSSASNVFLSGLHLARSEAIKRNSRAVLCKSKDGVACASQGGWEQGWIIFHDANNNGARETTETIVHRELPLSASLRLTGNLSVAKYVSFAPTGSTKLLGGGFQAGTLTVCNYSAEGGEARQIILNAAGRPRVQKAKVDSCA
jgi:type IV fimbrial biogenesis protein FimT